MNSLVELQGVQAGQRGWVDSAEALTLGLQLWPGLSGAGDVCGAQRMFFDADIVQRLSGRAGLLPQLPGGKKIETGTKTALNNDKVRGSLPARLPALG